MMTFKQNMKKKVKIYCGADFLNLSLPLTHRMSKTSTAGTI